MDHPLFNNPLFRARIAVQILRSFKNNLMISRRHMPPRSINQTSMPIKKIPKLMSLTESIESLKN